MSSVHTCSNPSDRGERSRPLAPADQVDLDAVRPGEQGDEATDRTGAEHQEPLPRSHAGGPQGPDGVPAGFDERAELRVHRVGEAEERALRDGQPLGERARPAAPDPDLVALRAEMLAPAATEVARAIAEHRVAGDPRVHPRRVDALTDLDHPARPFVARADRVGGLARVEVRHLAAEELLVGPAQADAIHLHDDQPRLRARWLDLAHLTLAGPADDEGTHRGGQVMPCGARSRPACSASARSASRASSLVVDASTSAITRETPCSR